MVSSQKAGGVPIVLELSPARIPKANNPEHLAARQVVTQLELRRSVLDLDERMRDLEHARSEIAEERDKADRLLHNILPASVVGELKARGRVEPRFYESATILFADFEGFTRLTERTDPKSLVEQLDQFFSAFDQIAERHHL